MALTSTLLLLDLVPLGKATGFLEEVIEIVKALALFEGFSKQECGVLCEYLECYGAPSHATIIREGEAGIFLAIVLTGNISVVKADDAGDGKAVANVGPGGFVGEMSLIDGKNRFASCITTEPSDIAVLTRDSLNKILVDHPRLGNKFLLMLLQLVTIRLRDATTRMLPTLADSTV